MSGNGTLYIGMTSNLVQRVWQHREKVADCFTERYGVVRLVWFAEFGSAEAAIIREKQLKKWKRAWKMRLIEKEKITYFVGVPTMSLEIMNHPDRDKYDLSSLKDITAGGAPRPSRTPASRRLALFSARRCPATGSRRPPTPLRPTRPPGRSRRVRSAPQALARRSRSP